MPAILFWFSRGISSCSKALTETRTPFAHLDFFYNPAREQSFPTSPGMTNLEHFSHLLQPRLNDVEGVDIPPVFHPNQPFLFKNKLLRMIRLWKEDHIGAHRVPTARNRSASGACAKVRRSAGKKKNPFPPFTTIFREKYGLSPYQYLLRLRIERAMDMMKTQKELTIPQIAEYCGFHSIQHLSMAVES